MESITEILDYANEHGVWPVLFLGLLLFGMPWLLKREKAHNDAKEKILGDRLKELKENQLTTQQMALSFNDTVNKFNNTIEGHNDQMKMHTSQMQAHTEQISKISISVNGLASSVSALLDRHAQNQYEQRRLEEDNKRLLSRINTTNDLLEKFTKHNQ